MTAYAKEVGFEGDVLLWCPDLPVISMTALVRDLSVSPCKVEWQQLQNTHFTSAIYSNNDHVLFSSSVTIQTSPADVIYGVVKKVEKSSGWGWKSEVRARVDEMPCLRQVER